MIYVGIDDTDTLDDPGTNQLARHLVRELAGNFHGRMILRHQLLEDPRVPCTKKNGCASIQFEPLGNATIDQLSDVIRPIMRAWCPRGSDPGLCVTEVIPPAIVAWGQRCQRELVTQGEARRIADEHKTFLTGLSGTEDGVIGALAAVGLMATHNDGRVVYFASAGEDWYDVTGCLPVSDILSRGVDEVRIANSDAVLKSGIVDIGKRLRPNFRNGKIVLHVAQTDAPHWEAVRMT
jgi:hypothetical protein